MLAVTLAGIIKGIPGILNALDQMQVFGLRQDASKTNQLQPASRTTASRLQTEVASRLRPKDPF